MVLQCRKYTDFDSTYHVNQSRVPSTRLCTVRPAQSSPLLTWAFCRVLRTTNNAKVILPGCRGVFSYKNGYGSHKIHKNLADFGDVNSTFFLVYRGFVLEQRPLLPN